MPRIYVLGRQFDCAASACFWFQMCFSCDAVSLCLTACFALCRCCVLPFSGRCPMLDACGRLPNRNQTLWLLGCCAWSWTDRRVCAQGAPVPTSCSGGVGFPFVRVRVWRYQAGVRKPVCGMARVLNLSLEKNCSVAGTLVATPGRGGFGWDWVSDIVGWGRLRRVLVGLRAWVARGIGGEGGCMGGVWG